MTNLNTSDTPQAAYLGDTAAMFADQDELEEDIATLPVEISGAVYNYVPWGDDDDTPLKLRRLMGSNMVTAQGMSFNVLCCYGQGLRFVNRDKAKTDTDDPEIRQWCLRNSLHETFMEMATDMKFYYWAVTVVRLNFDRTRIERVSHLETCFCRLEKRDEHGRIRHVFYGDFRDGRCPQRARAYELLDPHDPLGDLCQRAKAKQSATWEYAILSRMPTPGCRYYPLPYYMSIFRDHWYDIYELIGLGKKYMIKNTSAPRLQIEVHEDYWQNLCDYEGIIDERKRKARIDKEHQNLVDFVCGPRNAGKAMVTNYYIDPNGKENRMVRVMNLNSGTSKEGGDWSDDMEEASNALCFALGVHPNLIGATPGKSQMNNSGSDKRELFTLKQATERPFHDIMAVPWHVVLHFNQWADRYTIDIPMIELTTLDQHTSAKTTSGQQP